MTSTDAESAHPSPRPARRKHSAEGRTFFLGPNDTAVRVADLYALAASGKETAANIAKRHGISRYRLSEIFAEAGFPRLRSGRRAANTAT